MVHPKTRFFHIEGESGCSRSNGMGAGRESLEKLGAQGALLFYDDRDESEMVCNEFKRSQRNYCFYFRCCCCRLRLKDTPANESV